MPTKSSHPCSFQCRSLPWFTVESLTCPSVLLPPLSLLCGRLPPSRPAGYRHPGAAGKVQFGAAEPDHLWLGFRRTSFEP